MRVGPKASRRSFGAKLLPDAPSLPARSQRECRRVKSSLGSNRWPNGQRRPASVETLKHDTFYVARVLKGDLDQRQVADRVSETCSTICPSAPTTCRRRGRSSIVDLLAAAMLASTGTLSTSGIGVGSNDLARANRLARGWSLHRPANGDKRPSVVQFLNMFELESRTLHKVQNTLNPKDGPMTPATHRSVPSTVRRSRNNQRCRSP